MTSIASYIVAIPAYNEESSIVAALNGVYNASLKTRQELKAIIVCINGCTDNTEALVRKWDKTQVSVIYSEPGIIPAMNKLISYSKLHYSESAFIKTDADGIVDVMSFRYLFAQLDQHMNLQIAGGHPVPMIPSSWSWRKRFVAKILSVRGRVPLAEISVSDTRAYHTFANVDPLPNILDREESLKIYFHGRLWCARSASMLPFLPDNAIGEDVYIPGWLFTHYGKQSIRIDYRSTVQFKPNNSLRRHWMVYRRIYEDRNRIYGIDDFKEYAQNCPLKLDWAYILTKGPRNEILNFFLYSLVTRVESITFRMTKYKTKYWRYHEKEI